MDNQQEPEEKVAKTRKGVKDPKMKRTGNRWIPDTVEQRGGKRTKKAFRDFVLHLNALDGRQMKVEQSVLLCVKARFHVCVPGTGSSGAFELPRGVGPVVYMN